MKHLPEPLTPPDCNLRGLRWMPLDVQRVLDSDLFLMSSGAEFKAAFSLWAKSWSQVPAGSLPNNERILAQLAATKDWKRVREVALRGWILCADGRLYHPVIAEKALEAMSKREDHAEREENEESRQQRLRARRKAMFKQLREHGIIPAYDTKTAELERLIASLPHVTPETQTVTGGDTGDVTGDAPATAKEKDRTGQDITRTLEEPVVDHTTTREETPAPLAFESIKPTRGAAISLLMRQAGVEGCNAANPIVQEWAADARVTDDVLLTAADMAKKRDVLRPGPNYLKPIVEQLLNPKPAKPRDDWSRSPEGVLRKSREIGFGDGRPGESTDSLKNRIFDELARRERTGVSA